MEEFVRLVENKEGSLFSIDTQEGEDVKVHLQLKQKVGDDIRDAIMTGYLEPVLGMDFYNNQIIPGRIKVKESFEPIISTDPEAFLKRDTNGKLIRIQGKCVYRICYYSRDREDFDELID